MVSNWIGTLASQSQRLILWGCTIADQSIRAELFFADVRLPVSIKVEDRSKAQFFLVEIPQALRNSMYVKKGQHITLKRLG